jgi:metal-responsive CopG/Arc/MetJ family transcriptional regulator
MPKKVLVAMPPKMLEQIDYIALAEHRTRSDLIREALRRYLSAFRGNALPGIDMELLEPIKTLEEKLA